jgi:hypothetical protein
MTQSSSGSNPPVRHHVGPKDDNFLAVVILSGVFLVIFLAISTLFVAKVGTKLLPRVHARNAEPTSYLVQPAPQAIDAQMNVS